MTVPPTTTTTLFSTTWAAEPLIWTSFLAVSTWQFAQPPSTSWLDILFWLLLWVVTSRAWVLVRKPEGVTATSDEVWRRPAPEKQVSDAGGIFWSLVLVPLVCLAVGAQSTRDSDIWRLHAVVIALLTYSGWEKRGLLLLLLAALLLVSSWNYNDTIETANLVQLLLGWVALYYSMPRLSSHFHGVFTQGEWMVVTSLATLAFTQYTSCSLQEPTHGTVAMAGLLSVLVTCPIMQVIKRIKFEDSTVISSELLTLLFQLPFWIGLPLAGVEGLEFYWLRQSTTLATVPTVVAENLPVPIPRSLLWLIGFLLETETPLLTTSLPSLPRYGWLLYWLVVLILTIPFAPTQQDDSSTSIHKVFLMRKWFHGIAVLLFGPVTLAAPQLLSLSYAIAWAILILFESARSSLPMIASFHERYLDPSKDHAQRLVISHMALIVGCALPLWMAEWVGNALPPSLLALLALWGVLSLGIGDAMGAIVGVHMGQIQWSTHNSRTLEGSLAMWTSLAVSCWALVEFVVGEDFAATILWPCLATVTFVTLLEAHTFQVDNLVLPLAGAASLLLLTTSIQ